MLIAGVLCLCAALLCAATGLRSLARPRGTDPAHQAIRALAPVQLAAAVMSAAGAAVALAGNGHGRWVVLVICTLGAVATLATGMWQGARFALRSAESAPAECAGGCAACPLSCH